jgi:cytochrome c biogenesis protein CcdA
MNRQKWVTSSIGLLTVVILGFETVCALPLYLAILFDLSRRGQLTFEHAVHFALTTAGPFLVAALLFWAAIAEPIRRKK